MSEKRFSYEKECYRDEWYGYVGTYIDKEKGQYIEVPYNTVNPLVDTIMEQQSIIESKDKQLERLYNYFQDYLKDEMSGNAFSEMWDFVKEEESWEDE